jgi:hypothetical protein
MIISYQASREYACMRAVMRMVTGRGESVKQVAGLDGPPQAAEQTVLPLGKHRHSRA